MRIVHMLTSLGIGGAERQVVALAERMAARGHTVALLTLMPQLAREWPARVDVVRLEMSKSPPGVMAGLARAHRYLRGFRPDLVHSHTNHANLAARLLRLSGAAPRVLTTLHSLRDGGWPRRLAYRLTDGLAVHTTAVSQAVADCYLQAGAVRAAKFSVLANAVDAAEFAPDAARRMELRAELGVESAFVWLAAGRLTAAKDYPTLLRAFARVVAAAPKAQLWIAGESDEMLRRELECAVASEARRRVHWLGLRRDMPALLDACDGFVLSSAWEGMPLAVGEAMAMEKPVVATCVGGVPELMGETGRLVAPRDPAALAEAMLATMQQEPKVRAAEGRRARQRVVEHFGFDAKVAEWEALYEGLLRPFTGSAFR